MKNSSMVSWIRNSLMILEEYSITPNEIMFWLDACQHKLSSDLQYPCDVQRFWANGTEIDFISTERIFSDEDRDPEIVTIVVPKVDGFSLYDFIREYYENKFEVSELVYQESKFVYN